MFNRYQNNRPRKRFAHANYSKDSIKVQSHLTLTPAQMYGMALQGKPISTFQLPESEFDNGVIDEAENISVPMEEKRSVDVNDLWQNQKEIETKFKIYRNKKSIKYRTTQKKEE